MSGPTHSNRNYKVMKGYSLPGVEYIIEEWNPSNWDKETKRRSSVPVTGILRSTRKILLRIITKEIL